MADRIASSSFTRPADTTAYAIGDLVANSTTAGSVVVPSFTTMPAASPYCLIPRVRLMKSGTTITNASFRVHFFGAAPATITNGDNGAFSVSGAADYLGAFDVTVGQVFTDGAVGIGGQVAGSSVAVALTVGSTLYWLLEAAAIYTPASSEVFTLRPEIQTL